MSERTIEIRVTQFNATVEGRLDNWTAEKTFDETVQIGTAGTLKATITLASLSLGSVTAQAMGPDFFDTIACPTSVYAGEIRKAADGCEVIGTLTLKGIAMPLILLFALTLEGEKASMLGRTKLDRRSLGIGDNMADEKTLAFGVKVSASRAAE